MGGPGASPAPSTQEGDREWEEGFWLLSQSVLGCGGIRVGSGSLGAGASALARGDSVLFWLGSFSQGGHGNRKWDDGRCTL